jgi:hypothetical protein
MYPFQNVTMDWSKNYANGEASSARKKDLILDERYGAGHPQGDRILIPCNDVDRPLERDLIIGSRVVDQCHTLLLLLEI